MHTLKLLFMAMVIVVGTVMQLNAQTPEEKPQPPVMPPQTQTPPPSTSTSSPEGHGIFFNINIGGQSREQTFTESATFPLYNETGAVATTHAIGGSATVRPQRRHARLEKSRRRDRIFELQRR